ncbi:hypothetical protein E3V55_02125 [Candidatus Marinimicrobia bacterium MT.SAG.3]|nr:hypothetical protein E3V55_02125 [Candidatus Marinimicrobia bacterium MT.SAG.3]
MIKSKTAFASTILVFIVLVSGCGSSPNNNTDEISYLITIDKSDHKLARVKVSFSLKDSLLYMNRGANQLPKRWATFVHNVMVTDSKGKSILVEELPDAKWKMFAAPNEKITLTYEVKLDHEDYKWSSGIDGVAYAKDWGVFYTGRALLILHGDEWENIRVDFSLPQGWNVTTPWKASNDNKNSFKVNNMFELAESMIFAGLHQEISIVRDDFELVIALGGAEIIAQKDEYKKLTEGVLDYYIDLMGGIPNPSFENKFEKVVVIINSSTSTDGEVIGNNISILVEKNGGQMSEMFSKFIFAHELFHLWNGKSFTPTEDDTEWFKEGFTNYYTLKSLHHVGFLNDLSYLSVLNDIFFQRYNNDDGTGKLSMTMGEEKHAHWGLIYGGGLFVSIAQDLIIRNATQNRKSIDDLMRSLFQKYGATNDTYSIDELQNLLSKLSEIDQTEFFNSYVIGINRIPIIEYLPLAGLSAKIENGNLIITKKDDLNPLQQNILNGLFGIHDSSIID